MRFHLLACAIAAGCVRAPAPIDVAALIKDKGVLVARQDLEVHLLDEPHDVAAHLALAQLADDAHRPAQALAELEAVIRIGGPLGTRWHAADEARAARLLAARGRVRLARGAASALDDLERAKRYGAPIEPRELDAARAAIALAELRHIDAKLRAHGQATLAAMTDSPVADPSWLGAKAQPVPRDRGLFGAWLWDHGARRAAYEMLADWRRASPAHDAALDAAYLRALAWWTPIDLPPPPAGVLVGPERCRFAGACTAAAALADPEAAAALAAAPLALDTPETDAADWLALALPAALRGEAGWGEAVARHLDLATVSLAQLPLWARDAAGRLAGKRESGVADGQLAALTPAQRLVVAAGRVLAGASRTEVRAALGALEGGPEGTALLRILDPAPPAPFADPLAAALGAYLHTRHLDVVPVATLIAAYKRSPARADLVAGDAIAEAPDAALADAALGALYDVLGDPGRARAAWQAAVDLSPEPGFLAGLAEAMARANDPDAALINATTAAAAAGDPAVVWLGLARALDGVGRHVHALEAARSAIDLAGPEAIGPALDVAIAASRSLHRDGQVLALIERRRHVAAPVHVDRGVDDPTDATAAVAAHRRTPTVATIARMWVASRWNPRDVAVRAALLESIAPDDPRRTTLVTELVGLAADRDPATSRAAVAALL